MPEDVENIFSFHNFVTSLSGTLKKVLENDTATRYKISLNDLVVTKDKPGGVSIILKNGMEVVEY